MSTMRYRQGWRALNRLLHEDRSFSGHERNCAYLNLGNGQFADVSAVTSIDLPDDGRAVAFTDWDFDGRLDFWVTNRNAPRVRFLHNRVHPRDFLALKLQGDGKQTNRDAIGARVELHLSGTDPSKQIRTLHAGDGFLTQSTSWLHFFLPEEAEIDNVVVRWPGGAAETFIGLAAGGHYLLRQHSGSSEKWSPPRVNLDWDADPASLPQPTEEARVVLTSRLPLPSISYEKSDGGSEASLPRRGRPMLINLWASWCLPCLQELSAWSKDEKRLREAGLDIFALNTDRLDPDAPAGDPNEILRRIKFPWDNGFAKQETVRALDVFQRAMLDRWKPLPVPCSFLIDAQGRVAVVYKGPVELAQLLEDVKLLDSTRETWRRKAVPFAGRWGTDPPVTDPLRVAIQFIDHARVDEGMDYLQTFAQQARDGTLGSGHGQHLGDTLYALAVLLHDQGRSEEALTTYEEAARHNSDDLRVFRDWGTLLLEKGELEKAREALEQALAIRPDDTTLLYHVGMIHVKKQRPTEALARFSRLVELQPANPLFHFQRAEILRTLGDMPAALAEYRRVVELAPQFSPALNNLAWILATHPDDAVRQPQAAVEFARRLKEASAQLSLQVEDTYAAALAASGEFTTAVETLSAALREGAESMSGDRVEKIRLRLKLYEQGQAFVDESL